MGEGLVVIGVHWSFNTDKISKAVSKLGIVYPLAIDIESKTSSSFHANSIPAYYLIDRSGKLRFAHVASSDLDRAVAMLVKEPVPTKKKTVQEDATLVLKAAQERAKAEKKKLLVHLGAPW